MSENILLFADRGPTLPIVEFYTAAQINEATYGRACDNVFLFMQRLRPFEIGDFVTYSCKEEEHPVILHVVSDAYFTNDLPRHIIPGREDIYFVILPPPKKQSCDSQK